MTDPAHTNQPMLHLTEGGPTYRIEKRLGLVREESPQIFRRALLAVLLTWVPLLALSALQGAAIGHRVDVPFLRDFAVHARFLLAVPLLFIAETVLGPQLGHASAHFVHSGLVLEEDFGRFDRAIRDGLRWRDSTLAEVILIFVAYSFAALGLISMSIQASTWYAVRSGSTVTLTWAGWWFALFCVPFFQFLGLRWLWRLFLWGQFLWRMSKLNLQLIATHPDQAGGLAFVGESHRFFAIIILAFSTTVSGVLANDLVYDKDPLQHFAPLIATYVIVMVLLFILPLFVFAPILLKTKRTGLYKYGALATEYTASFQKKWVETRPPREEVLLGTGDIQSLADLGNSFAFIEKMDPVPMGPRTPLALVAACLIPMVPLLLTVMPLKDVLRMLLKFAV
jgi:hypothetical protein